MGTRVLASQSCPGPTNHRGSRGAAPESSRSERYQSRDAAHLISGSLSAGSLLKRESSSGTESERSC